MEEDRRENTEGFFWSHIKACFTEKKTHKWDFLGLEVGKFCVHCVI